MNRYVIGLFGAAVGALGAVTTVTMSQSKELPSVPRKDPEIEALRRAVSRVEQKLSAVDVQRQLGETVPTLHLVKDERQLSAAADSRDIDSSESDLEARRMEVENSVRSHRLEPLDREWAPTAKASLSSDLNEISKGLGGRLGAVSCATTTCVASVSWASKSEMVGDVGRLWAGPYQLGCATDVVLPNADVVPYEVDIFFDCEERRAGIGMIE